MGIVNVIILIVFLVAIRSFRLQLANESESAKIYVPQSIMLYGAIAIVILGINFAGVESVVYYVANMDKEAFDALWNTHEGNLFKVIVSVSVFELSLFAIIETVKYFMVVNEKMKGVKRHGSFH